MRLTPAEVNAIVSCTKTFFGEASTVRLFGSRANDSAHGGDIDLHIEAQSADLANLRNEMAFSEQLRKKIGDQRIDVIVRPPAFEPRAIDRIALETGVELR